MKPVSTSLTEHYCYECKRKFLPAPYHKFITNGRWFCKWTCYNAYKKRINQERAERARKRGKEC